MRSTPDVEKKVDEKCRCLKTIEEECGVGRFTLLRRLDGRVLDLQSLLTAKTESGMLLELSEFVLALTAAAAAAAFAGDADALAGRTGSSSTSSIVSDDCNDFCFVSDPEGGRLPGSSRLRTLSSEDLKE